MFFRDPTYDECNVDLVKFTLEATVMVLVVCTGTNVPATDLFSFLSVWMTNFQPLLPSLLWSATQPLDESLYGTTAAAHAGFIDFNKYVMGH